MSSSMMRFSKNLLLVLGVVVAIAFVALMVYDVVQINQLHAVAIANRSAGFANPRNWVMLGAALGLVAGLLLGLGIAMPSKSFKARYAEIRKQEAGDSARAELEDQFNQADTHVADPRGATDLDLDAGQPAKKQDPEI